MELVITLGSQLLGAVGVTGATAGGAAAGAAGGSSLLSTIVQGGLTAFSAAAGIAQGVAGQSAAKVDELNAAAGADREKIAGEDEALRINRALAESIGEQAVAFAAAGIDLSSGTPLQARQTARQRANEDLNINRSNTSTNVAAWNSRAYAARARGRAAMASGVAGAIGDIGGFGLDVIDRGGPLGKKKVA
ncbi:hypothetical protein [Mesorhizobium sp.]|uniref:hypothetical protein n=1 Tax=Mesorhizobium sp. TaxID=1871066 RepID=UPI000FE4F7F5|nr:hypothetical protein [Mesorhizobium sp.]RWE91348.1 MAG: hypothetical protein EOS68_28250 [Mesorhizobium sp.]